MFWRRKRLSDATSVDDQVTFDEAKEATRRAAFLNLAGRMSSDESYKQNLAELFRICRSAAISAGAAMEQSALQVDDAIAAQCDDDSARLKNASDRKFKEFVHDSAEIVKRFLAKLDQK